MDRNMVKEKNNKARQFRATDVVLLGCTYALL